MLNESAEAILTEPVEAHTEISDSAQLVDAPLVSVVMLAYNHEPYLHQAIEGALRQQTDFPFEILIGEDCSQDRTREVALRYQREHPERLRVVVSERNVGAMRNLMRVMRLCRGSIVAICEGDDYWIDPHKLAQQVRILRERPEVGIVFHSTWFSFGESETLEGPYVAAHGDRLFSPRDVILGGGGFMPTPSIVFRKEAMRKMPPGLLEGAPMADFPIQIYAAASGSAYYIDKPMSVYRRGHPQSWNHTMKNLDRVRDFENRANRVVLDIAATLPHLSDAFRDYLFRHNLNELLFYHYRNDVARIGIYADILERNTPLLTWQQRLITRMARQRALMLPAYLVQRLMKETRMRIHRKRYLAYV
jgi:glycosyltransferase involved in cell wall biosynthesis